MANLKLLYRSEAAGGVECAAGKTLQLGRERGLLLVLSQDCGEIQNGIAHQLAIATIEQCFKPEILTDKMLANPLQQLNRTKKCIFDAFSQYRKAQPQAQGIDAYTTMVWIKDGVYYVAGDLRVLCFNPVLGLRTLPADTKPTKMEMYDGDVLLLSTSDRYETIDDATLTAAIAENADNLSACYRALPAGQATLMAFVVDGAITPVKPAEPEKPVESKSEILAEKDEPLVPVHIKSGHYETHDDAPSSVIHGEMYWLIAAALMTISIIVLFCFF